MLEDHFNAKVIVEGKLGVHARVAAQIAREAQKYACKVTIRHNHKEADAKSILDILCLAAGQGSTLEFDAMGIDSDKVIKNLTQIFVE
mgnify:FL=1